ncbi:MAG: hypothetical protein LBH75_07680, partial [Treponema sp.]|nr:hypothetical protein [Treponema sp.]
HIVMVYFRRNMVRRSFEEYSALSHTHNTELLRELLRCQTQTSSVRRLLNGRYSSAPRSPF